MAEIAARRMIVDYSTEHRPQSVIVLPSDPECSRVSPSWAHFGHTRVTGFDYGWQTTVRPTAQTARPGPPIAP